jgi:outer membrane protein assembly factor BamD (BamD/ComL family)
MCHNITEKKHCHGRITQKTIRPAGTITPGLCVVMLYAISGICEEKVLMYDETRGIIFIDKNGKPQENKTASRPPSPAGTPRSAGTPASSPLIKKSSDDIHTGRQKDPPELYFKSGLQYFNTGDYMNALKNFAYARTASPKPEYFLWMGKAYRNLEQYDRMMDIMNEVRRKFPDSDVADDALFEIALYYETNNDYDMAIQKYTELAEQYPFGTSFADGEEYLAISRRQRQFMRGEMVSSLKVLGYEGKTVTDAYREFQRKNGLPVDGKPTLQTVRMIKAKYQQKLRDDTHQSTQVENVRFGVIASAVAAGILGLNLWLIIFLRNRTQQRQRLLLTLTNCIKDLDLKKT